MTDAQPTTADAIEQLRARGRQLAPPTDPTTGQAVTPAAKKTAAAKPPAKKSAAKKTAASSSTSTSSASPSTPRARQYRTQAGPPVHQIPKRQNATRAWGIKTPPVPQQVTSTAARGGGIMLGLVAYSIGINYLRNGWPGVTAWFAAKFLNRTQSGPGKANIISPNAPVAKPSGGTVSV